MSTKKYFAYRKGHERLANLFTIEEAKQYNFDHPDNEIVKLHEGFEPVVYNWDPKIKAFQARQTAPMF